jgi:hypothetical protein
VLAVLKEYNLNRHYMTNHKQKFKYLLNIIGAT